MPLLPANIIADPEKDVSEVGFATVVLGADLTTEVSIARRTGYVTKATLIPVGAAASDPTNTRKWEVQDATTRAPADGNIVNAASGQGVWNVATAYTAGQWVTLNNLPYVCILGVTGGTGPGVDTSHWSPIATVGLGWVNSLTANFTADDVGKVISDSGNTNIPAGSFVGAVIPAGSAGIATGVSAALLVSVVPTGGQATNPQNAPVVQPSQGTVANATVGTAVIGRTVTVGSSRVLATFSATAVSLVAGTPVPLVLSATDTRVFLGDVIKLVSTHLGTGVADPGGTLVLEVTNVGDGSN